MAATETLLPEVGQLVRARGQQWVVSALRQSKQPVDELAAATLPGRTLVTLTSVSDDDLGDELTLVWEVEPGRQIVPTSRLPDIMAERWDEPEQLGAFLDAVRWGTVASADTRTLQAPFRAGIRIYDYQLVPVARALEMPRVNLLIADDVGLGKTIEAGLIVQEMILRHRARRVVVVCPASLTGKWETEMKGRFGLEFTVLDSARLKELRRTHGLEANPFKVFPRTIISLQWLRSPRIQRLLDIVLTDETRHPGFFDLLIVDEAHRCAPPAPSRGKGYAVDSLQTQAVHRLGEHSQHRLFLSATPHNGYAESWQALLEMLDPQRFARGVDPDPKIVEQVMVRRLKDSILDADGNPAFPHRQNHAVEVTYTDEERRAHRLLANYTQARRTTPGATTTRLDDLVTLLLKKRLFSSPAAFARTLGAHRATLARAERASNAAAPGISGGANDDLDDLPPWLTEALSWEDEPSADTNDDDVEADLLDRAATLLDPPDDRATALLEELTAWAGRHAEPEDSKARSLVAELTAICRPGSTPGPAAASAANTDWSDERVIVFTEYVDTLNWLAGVLTARGLGGEHLGLIYGGMDERARDHLKAAFQAETDRHPLRILLATDAASEGIDLQNYCHRVINYDIPFNPNKLEQRIGRVDRLGQTEPVEVTHFVGAGWEHSSAGSYEADLEFLSRVAHKVATERRDLGSVNPVLAAAVEAQMLGRPVMADPATVEPKPAAAALRAEQDLRESMARMRGQLDDSVRRLHVAPANVRRVVDTALDLAGQRALVDFPPTGNGGLRAGLSQPPDLAGGWERTLADLPDPLDGTLRAITFDPAVANAEGDRVVLAHLEHPLVAQCTRYLRSAIWEGRVRLHRVTCITAHLPEVIAGDSVLVAAFGRLVVVGGDGARLHEEVIMAGRELPATGRSRRVELDANRYAEVRAALEASLDPGACRLGPPRVLRHLAEQWADFAPLLAEDLSRRAEQQKASLERDFASRSRAESDRTTAVFDQLAATLRRALEGPGALQLSFEDLTAPERTQVERDRRAWQARLDGLEADRARELAAVERRYQDVRPLVFPFAIVCAVASR